jgi:hypothetical protein
MQTVPIQPVPSQTLNITLNDQGVTLVIYQRSTGLYIDIQVGTTVILTGVVCLNDVRIVRDAYLGFSGDLVFIDTQGQDDPVYTGLGTRWSLVYLAPSDL